MLLAEPGGAASVDSPRCFASIMTVTFRVKPVVPDRLKHVHRF